jgi:ABC-type multidrug transport system fused ATPase/permease subunit
MVVQTEEYGKKINEHLRSWAHVGGELQKASTIGELAVPIREEILELLSKIGLKNKYLDIEQRRDREIDEIRGFFGEGLSEDQRRRAIEFAGEQELKETLALLNSIQDPILRNQIIEKFNELESLPAEVELQIFRNIGKSIEEIGKNDIKQIIIPLILGLITLLLAGFLTKIDLVVIVTFLVVFVFWKIQILKNRIRLIYLLDAKEKVYVSYTKILAEINKNRKLE